VVLLLLALLSLLTAFPVIFDLLPEGTRLKPLIEKVLSPGDVLSKVRGMGRVFEPLQERFAGNGVGIPLEEQTLDRKSVV